MGYHRAGFDVVGVDVAEQAHYPFLCYRMDAIAVLSEWDRFNAPGEIGGPFDAIHASPPCQAYTQLRRLWRDRGWPDLIPLTRRLLMRTGLPYVIENVEGAPLRRPVTLCGVSFPELHVIRHRLFESNVRLPQPRHQPHPLVFTTDKRKRHYGSLPRDSSYVQVHGHGNAQTVNKRAAMGIAWYMTNREVSEAIPPAYTALLGARLLRHVGQTGAAARAGTDT